MIVRNEAPVIRRCLASVLPIIDYWAIVDTGSTDGTQGLITEYLEGVPASWSSGRGSISGTTGPRR